MSKNSLLARREEKPEKIGKGNGDRGAETRKVDACICKSRWGIGCRQEKVKKKGIRYVEKELR